MILDNKNTIYYFSGSANMLEKEKKMNVNLKNNLECNKVNQNSSKDKVKNKKVKCKYKKIFKIHIFSS